MALFWRIWAAVAVVTFAVLAIFVGLATLQFDSIHSNLVGERLIVLADRTATPFEAAAKLGLPLEAVRNAPALLERARQTDEAIGAIHVFDSEGRIVHSTNRPVPAAIPAVAEAKRRIGSEAHWHAQAAENFLGGVGIVGRTGTPSGGMLVVYPNNAHVIQVRAMAAELALAAIVVFLGAAVLSGLLIRYGLSREIEAFESIDAAIAQFERSAWRSAAGATIAKASEDEADLRSLLDAAEASYRAAGQAIAAEHGRPR